MAVYTQVSDEEVRQFLARYDLGEVQSLKGIAEGVENSNYLLVTTRGSFILTLYEKRVDPADLPFFLGLMQHLASRGVTCPLPVADRAGGLLGILNGRPAAIVTFLAGLWPRRPSPAQCGAVGSALASLHRAGEGFALDRENALSLQGWQRLAGLCTSHADQVQPGLCDLVQREVAFLAAHWPGDLPAGVIHADLFPDNVFFQGETLSGIIDFYFACRDLLAYDLAICLNAWCFEEDLSFNATKSRRLLLGYARSRALTRQEAAALPILARGAALRFLLTRLYDWAHTPEGALVRPKDPIPYARRLRFHAGIRSLAEYGVEAEALCAGG